MSKLGKEGQNWHYRSCFKSLNDKKIGIVLVSYKIEIKQNVKVKEGETVAVAERKWGF